MYRLESQTRPVAIMASDTNDAELDIAESGIFLARLSLLLAVPLRIEMIGIAVHNLRIVRCGRFITCLNLGNVSHNLFLRFQHIVCLTNIVCAVAFTSRTRLVDNLVGSTNPIGIATFRVLIKHPVRVKDHVSVNSVREIPFVGWLALFARVPALEFQALLSTVILVVRLRNRITRQNIFRFNLRTVVLHVESDEVALSLAEREARCHTVITVASRA